MTEKTPVSKKGFSADWLMQGALTRIGDTFDRLTGRKWIPSSSLATSELAERIKKLLDAEARQIPGKGTVVPHNIKLKMQWDKFSSDAEDALTKLRYELLASTVDHINDCRYYTYAPLQLLVTPDYFTEGVKLFVSFDKFDDEERDVEMNVTVPAMKVADLIPESAVGPTASGETYIARFQITGVPKEKRLEFPVSGSLSVGRTGENSLTIEDASVSKIHASLVVGSDGQVAVADTGSTNGTFINDQRISYGKATKLVDGDRVKFGVVEVVFEHVPRPPVVETEAPAEETADDGAVAIDGFEFKRKVSPETPEDSAPTIPIPDETAKIPDETAKIEPESEKKPDEKEPELPGEIKADKETKTND